MKMRRVKLEFFIIDKTNFLYEKIKTTSFILLSFIIQIKCKSIKSIQFAIKISYKNPKIDYFLKTPLVYEESYYKELFYPHFNNNYSIKKLFIKFIIIIAKVFQK